MMSRLFNLVLGPPGRKRLRVLMVLLTVLIYGGYAVVQQAEVLLGFIDPQASAWLMAFTFLGSLVFYLLIRSGWSERIPSDPALMSWQTAHGVLAILWCYAITGPARGAMVAALLSVLAYGMFGLPARQARLLALFAILGLAATMVWKSQTDPTRYPPVVEAVHLALAVIVLLTVSALAVRMGSLREHLRVQKLELAASLERIRLLATQDELTSLVNRRHMLALLKAEQARQHRAKQPPLGLALLDLDHFKRINDTYGHNAGDIVLRGFSDAARGALRGSDVLSRWGGEEFLLMLPDTGEDEAERCVERIRQCLTQVTFSSVAPDLKITFSAGLSACRPGDSLETAIERADQALYRAKAQGRNRTVHG
jgi:diguanylate cyclase (GGDEF)-like protein